MKSAGIFLVNAIVLGLAFTVLPTGAFAQVNAPNSNASPPAVSSSGLSLEEARVIAAGAIAYANENKMRMGVVIVDTAGDVITADRMDGSPYRNVHFAIGKAFASAIFNQTTEALGDIYKTRPDRYFGIQNMYPGKVYLVGGGVPLVLDGKMLGAVGVAGLPQGVDEKAGRAGIEALMAYREKKKR
ncbi:MAG: hypothetical protein JWL86_6246 [Rhizobium sp.]|jgi:glc operon protein GlcG|nr:hypothetical protein [Rhizobium sp.]